MQRWQGYERCWSRSGEFIRRRRLGRNVFLSDREGDEDYVAVNEDYPDPDPDDPDADELDSDDRPKQPQKKKSKLVMDGREKTK